MSKDNKYLVTACYVLDKVDSILSDNMRSQLSRESLQNIQRYLAMVVKYVDEDNKLFSNQLLTFNQCIVAIGDLLGIDGGIVDVKSDVKEYINNKVCPEITRFKVNVGTYLTDHQFDYDSSMDRVLASIVDTCIKEGYYFGY